MLALSQTLTVVQQLSVVGMLSVDYPEPIATILSLVQLDADSSPTSVHRG